MNGLLIPFLTTSVEVKFTLFIVMANGSTGWFLWLLFGFSMLGCDMFKSLNSSHKSLHVLSHEPLFKFYLHFGKKKLIVYASVSPISLLLLLSSDIAIKVTCKKNCFLFIGNWLEMSCFLIIFAIFWIFYYVMHNTGYIYIKLFHKSLEQLHNNSF